MRITKVIVCCALLGALTGCGVSRRGDIWRGGPAEAAAATSSDLCIIAKSSSRKPTQAVLDEVKRRNLGDCTEEHAKCAGYGFQFGTPAYANCRLELEMAESRVRAAEAGRPVIVQESAPAPAPAPYVAPTTCNTLRTGPISTTNCF